MSLGIPGPMSPAADQQVPCIHQLGARHTTNVQTYSVPDTGSRVGPGLLGSVVRSGTAPAMATLENRPAVGRA